MEQIETTKQKGKNERVFQFPASLTSSSPLSPFHLSLVYRSYNDNQHQNTKKVKSRGEVRGSTRKIYKQKGTGGARHGACSAPQFRGGGVAFGPTGQRGGPLKVNQKLKKKVFRSLLGEKIHQQNLIVVDQITLDNYKAKEAEKLLTDLLHKDLKSQVEKLKQEINSLKAILKKTPEQEKDLTEKEQERTKLNKKMKKKTKTLIVLSNQEEKKAEITRSFRNLPYLNKIADSKTLNFFEVLNSNYLIFTSSALKELTERLN